MRERTIALATFAVALLAFVVFGALPFVTREREQPATVPDPPALREQSIDTVPPGGRICMRDIAIDEHSAVARIYVATFGRRGQPLELTVTGAGGYRSSASERGGYADNLFHSFRITPPDGDRFVSVCVRNRGTRKVALYAANDSAHSLALVTINGRRVSPTPTLAFYEAKERTILERVPLSVERIARFRGPLGYAWIVWVLVVLFVAGLPLGYAAVVWRGWS